MVKGMYHYIGQAWQNPSKDDLHTRLIKWRAGNSIVVVEKPLRLDRARALGYKAKKGFVVVRVRLKRGGRKRPRHKHGRKTRKQHVSKILKMNYRWVAEQRAEKAFSNLEVLNSYYIGQDGKFFFFEVLLIDPEMPEIKGDSALNWIANPQNKNRAARGITSAARKSRGLRYKGPNRKVRPSARAWGRIGK